MIADGLLVPPTSLALIALGSALARGRLARLLATGCLVALVALAMPVISGTLLVSLEHGFAAPSEAGGDPPAAIVVLGADLETDIDRPNDADPGPLTLERLRAAAALARKTGLPILVSGGLVREGAPPVAEVMARALRDDFGIVPRWVERRSADTWRNATETAAIMRSAGIRRVFVVTHAWHLSRALMAFSHAGLSAVPAPVRLDRAPEWRLGSFVPRASAWWTSYLALHEWVGGAVYAARARS